MALPAILGVAARATGSGLATGARYAGRAAWSGLKSGINHSVAAQRNPLLSKSVSALESLSRVASAPSKPKPEPKTGVSNQEKAEADEHEIRAKHEKAREAILDSKADESTSVLKIISHDTKDILAGIELLVEDGMPMREKKGGGGLFGTLLSLLGGLTIFSKGFLPTLGGFLTRMATRVGATISGMISRTLGSIVSSIAGLGRGIASTAATVGRTALAGGRAVAGTAAAAGRHVGRVGTSAVSAATGSTGRMIAKAGGKSVLKKIPVIGAGVGLALAGGRAMAGDWTGAGMEAASGLLGTIPGIGTAASIGIDAAIIRRDMQRRREAEGTNTSPEPIVEEPAPTLSAPSQPDVGTPPPRRGGSKTDMHLDTISYTLRSMLSYMTTPYRGIYTQPVDKVDIFDWKGFFSDTPTPGNNSYADHVNRSTPSSANSSLSASGDDAALLDLIAKGEAGPEGYDSVWGGSRVKPAKPLSEMTFGEVKQWQRDTLNEQRSRGVPADRRSSAAGRYQFISGTLAAQQKSAGFSDDDIFSPENQDKLALSLLNADRNRGLTAWREGRATDEQFINYVSSQWAAFKNTSGRGTYDAAGFNHGSIGGSDLIAAANRRSQPPRAASPAEPVSSQVRESVINNNAQWRAPMVIPQPVPVPVASSGGGSSGAPSSVVPMITQSPDTLLRAFNISLLSTT